MSIEINQINECSNDDFMAMLGSIYEHSPWVAQQVSNQRPFADLKTLHETMKTAVSQASKEEKLALLRAHPELAGKEAETGQLTEDSEKEQGRAGLNLCSPEELAIIRDCNQRYQQQFGFPFIIAVSGLNRQQIIEAMQQRLNHSSEQEFDTALAEVDKIAWIRLQSL